MACRHISRVSPGVNRHDALAAGHRLQNNLGPVPIGYALRPQCEEHPLATWQRLWAGCQFAFIDLDQHLGAAAVRRHAPDPRLSLSKEDRPVLAPPGTQNRSLGGIERDRSASADADA